MKIKINKNLIATYLSLDSKKANDYLANLSSRVKTEILSSSDNDEIYEYLELLGEFVYKVPKETTEIVSFLISKESTDPKIHKTPLGEFEGKSHKDLILKTIGLLNQIRYIAPDEVLDLVFKLSKWEDKEIINKAIEVVKRFAKYDYNVLAKSNIGYGPQRKILDFILILTSEEQIKYLDFIEVVAKALLSSSFEGMEWSSVDKVNFHFGAITPTDFLKTIRRETIDLVYNLYQNTTDSKVKQKLINVLEEATRTPSNVKYTKNLEQMIIDDIKYLTDIYRKIIFDDGGNIIADPCIVEEIESRLYWLNRSEKFGIEVSKKLRSDILSDSFYSVFRLLVGDSIIFREEEGSDSADEKLSKEIDKLLKDITGDNLDKWIADLNRIADQQKIIDDWKFQNFKALLQKIAMKKPVLADKLLNNAFDHNKSLKNYSMYFLNGFRYVDRIDLWDKYAEKIINAQDSQLLSALIYSLNLPDGTDLGRNIREKDINLLEDIVTKKASFSFIKNQDDLIIHYALINTLCRNYKRDPKKIELLIVNEINDNPKHLKMLFLQFPTMIRRKWIDIQEFNEDTISFLKTKMVDLSDIDGQIQILLLAIGQRDGVQAVMNIFLNRILKDTESKEKHGHRIDENYETIPNHLNSDLCIFITGQNDYKKIAIKWIENMTTETSDYNLHVSHFLQIIGIGFNEILISIIEKGDDDSLMKASRIMHSIEGVDFGLCIEIVRSTDNEQILNKVRSNMYSTGVVSGEYGLADAYENKAKELDKHKDDENEHVRKFVKRMIESFRDSAARERKSADEEKQLRKIEFEG